MANKSGAIYWFQCGDLTCDDEYIRETSRTYGERFKEHLKETSPIHHHSINTGHPATQHNFQIIGSEGHGITRTIKESIYIRVNSPTLNRNIDKYSLHYIWDGVLLNTPGIKMKRHAQTIGHAQNTQPNSSTPLNQPNMSIPLRQPNTPCNFSMVLWSMLREHLCRSMCIEPPRMYIGCSISVFPQTWWSLAVDWWKLVYCQEMFCSRESTNYYLFSSCFVLLFSLCFFLFLFCFFHLVLFCPIPNSVSISTPIHFHDLVNSHWSGTFVSFLLISLQYTEPLQPGSLVATDLPNWHTESTSVSSISSTCYHDLPGDLSPVSKPPADQGQWWLQIHLMKGLKSTIMNSIDFTLLLQFHSTI